MKKYKEASLGWILLMARRDIRKNPGRLFLFIASIILGIAALTGINAFNKNVQQSINKEAKNLLTADLRLHTYRPLNDSALKIFKNSGALFTRKTSFGSMVLFPGNGTRLVQVNGIEPDFPIYGKIKTRPDSSVHDLYNGRNVLVDKNLIIQFDSNVGDSIKIGDLRFKIAGIIEDMPGQISLFSSVARPVFISRKYLKKTGLLKEGSHIKRNIYIKTSKKKTPEAIIKKHKDFFDSNGINYETVKDRKEKVGRAFNDLSSFLNLIAFIALVLGCIGVASSVQVYVREKIRDVAILRCLGVQSKDAFLIYLSQIFSMAFLGAFTGAIAGIAVQQIIPFLLQSFLPFELGFGFSYFIIIKSTLIGTGLAVLFAFLPLSSTLNVPPLMALRINTNAKITHNFLLKFFIYFLILTFIYLFLWQQTDSWLLAVYFTSGLFLALALLYFSGSVLIFLSRKLRKYIFNFELRQGIANLSRPDNQTRILILSIGMGVALLSTLFFIQNLLLQKLSISSKNGKPDTVLFDIQTDQKQELKNILTRFDIPLINQVPLVPMRLQQIRQYSANEIKRNDSLGINDYVVERQYRVTYRDSLISSERILKGKFTGKYDGKGLVPVSVAKRLAEDMNAKVGDKLFFNVQGTKIKTKITSIRKVDWNRIQTNFVVVFPENILEDAPKSFAFLCNTKSQNIYNDFRETLVKKMPNVSIIDLDMVIATLNNILDKVTFAIQFMSIFSIGTGIIVLFGVVNTTRFQRIKESVLMKTLGALKKNIIKITAYEYIFAGAIAALSGIILGIIASWLLSIFIFDMIFIPSFTYSIYILIFITLLVLVTGLLNLKGILNKPPLEVLRYEE